MRKKILSIIMVIIIAVTTNITALASETARNPSEERISFVNEDKSVLEIGNELHEDHEKNVSRAYQLKVEALGEELFPEYVQKASESMNRARTLSAGSTELGDVTYSETKPVSDNESLTYTEYTSGRASLLYHKFWTNTSSSTAVSGGTQYRTTCVVTVSGCYGSVYTSGFTYTINLNSYDWIDSIGTCHDNYNLAIGTLQKKMEDASPARAAFAGNVEDILFQYTVGISFEIRVGGNAARVYAGGSQI